MSTDSKLGIGDKYNEQGFNSEPLFSVLPVNFYECTDYKTGMKRRSSFVSTIIGGSNLTKEQVRQIKFQEDLHGGKRKLEAFEEVDSWPRKVD